MAMECRSGPVPPPPGGRIVVARRVSIDARGAVRQRTMYATPPPTEATATLPPPILNVTRNLARAALEGGPYAPEAPPPDGTACRVEIAVGARRLTAEAAAPTRHAALEPLMTNLYQLLPALP